MSVYLDLKGDRGSSDYNAMEMGYGVIDLSFIPAFC